MRIPLIASLSILLVVGVIPGLAADPDPASLVKQLGSTQPAEREAAAKALKSLGLDALPALRAGREGKDGEIQERVTLLMRKIEAAQLLRPTMVALDFQDRPMSDVMREINRKTGFRLTMNEEQVDWLSQRSTLREPAQFPLWKAIDRICEAGHFQSNLGNDNDGVTISLFKGYTSGPASDHGLFRVQFEEIYYKGRHRILHCRQDDSSRPIYREEDRENSYVKMRIMAEPHMKVASDGKLKDLHVIDETGQSLVPSGEAAGEPDPFHFSYYELVYVPLKPIERPGRMIRKLQGSAPVAVAVRRPNPIIIPLENVAGNSFHSDESIVKIRSVRKVVRDPRADPDLVDDEEKPKPEPEVTEIEVAIRPIERRGSMNTGHYISEDQFEMVDADGRIWNPSPWFLSDAGPRLKDGETRLRLTPVDEDLTPWNGDLARLKLRYYDKVVVKVDVSFEFNDIPLP